MKPIPHVIISASVSAGVFALSRSPAMTMACFVSGILIDIDHVFDYLREYGLRIGIRHFLDVFYRTQFARVLLIFHGWEWVIAGAVVAWSSRWHPLLTGALIGVSHHLVVDQFTNATRPLTYSVIWRFTKGFSVKECFPGARIDPP